MIYCIRGINWPPSFGVLIHHQASAQTLMEDICLHAGVMVSIRCERPGIDSILLEPRRRLQFPPYMIQPIVLKGLKSHKPSWHQCQIVYRQIIVVKSSESNINMWVFVDPMTLVGIKWVKWWMDGSLRINTRSSPTPGNALGVNIDMISLFMIKSSKI